jgi:SPP1 family predicted phage head-tail adaptor
MKRFRSKQTMVVKRKQTTESTMGFEIDIWVKAFTTKGGYIDAISGKRVEQAEKMVNTSTHTLICEVCDIRNDDRIVISGKIYRVNYVYNPMEANHHLEVELELVTEDNRQPVNQIYFGLSTNTLLTATEILLLNSQETEKKSLRQTLTPVDEYIYFAYPIDFGRATVRLNEMLDLSFTIEEVVINGINHYVYRSGSLLNGSYELEVI